MISSIHGDAGLSSGDVRERSAAASQKEYAVARLNAKTVTATVAVVTAVSLTAFALIAGFALPVTLVLAAISIVVIGVAAYIYHDESISSIFEKATKQKKEEEREAPAAPTPSNGNNGQGGSAIVSTAAEEEARARAPQDDAYQQQERGIVGRAYDRAGAALQGLQDQAVAAREYVMDIYCVPQLKNGAEILAGQMIHAVGLDIVWDHMPNIPAVFKDRVAQFLENHHESLSESQFLVVHRGDDIVAEMYIKRQIDQFVIVPFNENDLSPEDKEILKNHRLAEHKRIEDDCRKVFEDDMCFVFDPKLELDNLEYFYRSQFGAIALANEYQERAYNDLLNAASNLENEFLREAVLTDEEETVFNQRLFFLRNNPEFRLYFEINNPKEIMEFITQAGKNLGTGMLVLSPASEKIIEAKLIDWAIKKYITSKAVLDIYLSADPDLALFLQRMKKDFEPYYSNKKEGSVNENKLGEIVALANTAFRNVLEAKKEGKAPDSINTSDLGAPKSETKNEIKEDDFVNID